MNTFERLVSTDQVSRKDVKRQRLRVWLRLLKLSKFIESELRERLRLEFETTLPRFDVLAALGRERCGMKMSELSATLMVSNGNVTGIVERLVSDGLIVRVPIAGDRRAMQVRLTRRGEEEFEKIAAVHADWIDGLFSGLDADDAEAMITLLDMARESENKS